MQKTFLHQLRGCKNTNAVLKTWSNIDLFTFCCVILNLYVFELLQILRCDWEDRRQHT